MKNHRDDILTTWMQTKIVKGWGYPWPTSSGVYEGFG